MSGALGAVWASLSAGASALGDLVLPRVCGACDSPDISTGRLCQECNIRLLALVSNSA